jgi:2-oxoglutarate/2-oxoacid ferredoxin oxidoreductase subunit beta
MGQIESAHNAEMAEGHPLEELLKSQELPHDWCPGCGLGIVTKCLAESIRVSGIPLQRHAIVSGNGCTSRLLDCLSLDTYRMPEGSAIPFATGLKIANRDLEVTVVEGDGDLFSLGGNHLLHAIRRNVDLNVFCVNNFGCAITGGQPSATTPTGAKTATTPYGNFETPFNVPYLVAAAGAPFVSRWTTLHVRQLLKAMQRAFQVQGLAFVEIVSPCPTSFGESNNFADGHAQMEYFRNCSRVDEHADLSTLEISMKPPDPIILGNFVDKRRPTYHELEHAMIEKRVE